MISTRILLLTAVMALGGLPLCRAAESATAAALPPADTTPQRQLILWTSGDREVALHMVFMYAENCANRKWMDGVRLMVWGPSGKLLVQDSELQQRLQRLRAAGVELYACKACADEYGIAAELSKLGITVMYTGTMLADLQKAGWHVLSI